MGKTPKPLTIIALPPCSEWEELAKLEKQGHKVIRVDDKEEHCLTTELVAADIILAPQAWRMDTKHKPYLTLAIKEARMLRYPTHEEKADVKKRRAVADALAGD